MRVSMNLPEWVPPQLWREAWTIGMIFAIALLLSPTGTMVERFAVLILIPCSPMFLVFFLWLKNKLASNKQVE